MEHGRQMTDEEAAAEAQRVADAAAQAEAAPEEGKYDGGPIPPYTKPEKNA
jgi:hypothetical protein